MSKETDHKIHIDYMIGSSHTVYAINRMDIIDEYSQEHRTALIEELTANGNQLLAERGDYAFIEFDAGQVAHEHISLSWDGLIKNLKTVTNNA